MSEHSLSLWAIDEALAQLVEMREEMVAAGEDTAATDAEISRYLNEQLPAKVDGIIGFIRRDEAIAAAASAEADRLKGIASARMNRVKRIKDYLLAAMQHFGRKKVEGHTGGSISVQVNGGLVPLIVDDEALVPDEYCDITVTVPESEWQGICACLYGAGFYHMHMLADWTRQSKRQPNNARIREALQSRCEHCDGAPAVGSKDECQHCGGTGKQGVPGAHLGDRGSQVRIR